MHQNYVGRTFGISITTFTRFSKHASKAKQEGKRKEKSSCQYQTLKIRKRGNRRKRSSQGLIINERQWILD